MKFRTYIFTLIVIAGFSTYLYAAQSVTLTPLDSPDTLSNGKSYFLAGKMYRFRVQAIDPLAGGRPYWNTITLDFNGPGAGIERSCQIQIEGGDAVISATGVSVVINNNTVVWTNLDYQLDVTFLWNATDFNAVATNTVTADIDDDGANGSDTRTFNYGICSQIQIMNFSQDGDAADGYVNPWHGLFNVTGRIVYYVALEPLIINRVEDLDPGETGPLSGPGSPQLIMAGAASINDSDGSANLSFTVPLEYMNTNFGATSASRSWRVNATMQTGGASVTSQNQLGIWCNRIDVANVTFENGGGANEGAPPTYYIRSVSQAGTLIRINAALNVAIAGNTNMIGNTTFRIRYSVAPADVFTVTIPGGAGTATAVVPIPAVGAGNTTLFTYLVEAIYGSAFDGTSGAPQQYMPSAPARITGTTSRNLYWDNADPPGDNSPTFTTLAPSPPAPSINPLPTATSFTIYWTPVTIPGPDFDYDFDSYRIYYKRQVDATYIMVDKSVIPALGTISTASAEISGLESITIYDYRLSAVDVFGNEVDILNQLIGSVSTTASQIDVTLSDGISAYKESGFDNPDPSQRQVRDTAIKITIKITSAGNPPDRVTVIIAGNDSDLPNPGPPMQYGATGVNDDIVTLTEGTDRWTLPCAKIAPNTWETYIPSDHPLMVYGTNIRFIVATTEGTSPPAYSDHTDDDPNALPPIVDGYQQHEWRFRVGKRALFIPWPTRVLNNVMTAQLPCCFPAYFIPVDSLVTMKVYDVKGRVIATLCEKLYRPGGQNIKDLGWCGRNKDNRRVGPGLYYIHIKATTFGNKTVLDKFMKVVVAH
ncbi:MAG: hypothetical protein A2176_00310 [Spirochaetes bacterium RBG_13_51_14]|nr:MAG: hypothetical protein A2176_00310 [Spirochaetes bacterium RBG_13_51_14]